jgi:hypothetical protein
MTVAQLMKLLSKYEDENRVIIAESESEFTNVLVILDDQGDSVTEIDLGGA